MPAPDRTLTGEEPLAEEPTRATELSPRGRTPGDVGLGEAAASALLVFPDEPPTVDDTLIPGVDATDLVEPPPSLLPDTAVVEPTSALPNDPFFDESLVTRADTADLEPTAHGHPEITAATTDPRITFDSSAAFLPLPVDVRRTTEDSPAIATTPARVRAAEPRAIEPVLPYGPTRLTPSPLVAPATASEPTASTPSTRRFPWLAAFALALVTAATATVTVVVQLRRAANPLEVVAAQPSEPSATRDPGPSARALENKDEPGPETAHEQAAEPAQERPDPSPSGSVRENSAARKNKPSDTAQTTSNRPAELLALRTELDRALSSRGLRVEDLEPLGVPSAAIERWQRSLRGPTNEARAALDGVLGAMRAAPTTPAVVKGKLARVSSRLESLPSSVTASDREALEKRYFALRAQLRPQSSEAECTAVAREVNAFERDLDALTRR